jgi:hypothetical protein
MRLEHSCVAYDLAPVIPHLRRHQNYYLQVRNQGLIVQKEKVSGQDYPRQIGAGNHVQGCCFGVPKKKMYQKCVVNDISLLVLLAYEGTWSVLEILLDCELGKRDGFPRRNALPNL